MMTQDELLISLGGNVKSLGGAKVGGYAVVFGGHDVVHDRFLPTTDFDLFEGKSVPVLFDHGLDPVIKKRRLGRATLKADAVGLWFESILEQRSEYEQKILELIKAGKLGISSGSAGHMVERKTVGKINEILAWPIAEVSYTHRPAEIRTSVISLKSYLEERHRPLSPHERRAEAAYLHARQTLREGELLVGPPYAKPANKR